MASIHQVSFYHECGHSEDCLWISKDQEPLLLGPLPESGIIPSIDFTRVMVDEKIANSATGLHYQNKKCGTCEGVLPAALADDDEQSVGGELSELTIKDRRLLWRSVIDAFKVPEATLEQRHEIRIRRIQTDAEALSEGSTFGANGSGSWEAVLKRPLDRERKWYQDFILLHFRELQLNTAILERTHLYAPGWHSELYAAVDNATIPKDETCGICQEKCGLRVGRVVQLPCNKHQFHFQCIDPWIDANHSCPMCRTKFKILHPPTTWNDVPDLRYGRDELQPEQLNNSFFQLGAALESALLADRPSLEWRDAPLEDLSDPNHPSFWNRRRELNRAHVGEAIADQFGDRWDQYTRE